MSNPPPPPENVLTLLSPKISQTPQIFFNPTPPPPKISQPPENFLITPKISQPPTKITQPPLKIFQPQKIC